MKDNIFDKHTGIVKTSHIVPEKKVYYTRDDFGRENDDQRLIDFCLNCKKKKCRGNCYEYTEYAKSIKGKKGEAK